MPTLFQHSNLNMTPEPISSPPQISPSSVPHGQQKPIPVLGHDPVHLFTAYAENPTGVTFETQLETEVVILFMRKHFVVNVPWIFATILLLVAPLTIIPFFFMLVPPPIVLPASYKLIGLLLWYIATFGYALLNFLHWYYNIYIVTTERVIEIDFIQLLYKKFSEAKLDRIEDVTYVSTGFFAAVFNFGDVSIQTAGEAREFDFESIPKPATVVRTIESLIDQEGPRPQP